MTRPLASPHGDGGLIWLTTTTVAWLLAGILVFHLGERTAIDRGTLSRS